MIDFPSEIKVRKRILLRTRYLNLLQAVKVIITVNKIKSHPVFAGQVAFYYKMHVQIQNNIFFLQILYFKGLACVLKVHSFILLPP